MRALWTTLALAFPLMAAAPASAGTDECNEAIETYNNTVSDLSDSLRRYTRCLSATAGQTIARPNSTVSNPIKTISNCRFRLQIGLREIKLLAREPAKHHAVEAAFRIADMALETSGGGGMFRGNELERLFRDARCGRFHPANSFLTHEIVGKTALGVDLGEQPRWGREPRAADPSSVWRRSSSPLTARNIMTDEETVLAGRLMSVLTSPEAQRISFRLGTISVDGGGLYAVFSALSLGVISVTIADVPAGAAAQYSTSKNTFIFPRATYGTLPYDNVYMLHESVHAMQDIEFGMINPARGTFYTKESENEAAAYVEGLL